MPGCSVSLTTERFCSVVNRRRRATPVMTSTFENVSDIGVCLGLCLAPPANAGVRSKRGAVHTHASPGQGTLQISSDKAPDGDMAVIVIKNRKTGEGLKYTITDEWLPKILGWIKSDPSARYDSAMSAEGLFQVQPVK